MTNERKEFTPREVDVDYIVKVVDKNGESKLQLFDKENAMKLIRRAYANLMPDLEFANESPIVVNATEEFFEGVHDNRANILTNPDTGTKMVVCLYEEVKEILEPPLH